MTGTSGADRWRAGRHDQPMRHPPRPAPAMTLSGRRLPCRAEQPADGLHRLSGRIPRAGGQPIHHHVTGPHAGPRTKVRLAAPTRLRRITGDPSAATQPPATTWRPIGHIVIITAAGQRSHPPGGQIIRSGSPASRAPAASLRERSAPPDPGPPVRHMAPARGREGQKMMPTIRSQIRNQHTNGAVAWQGRHR